MRILGEIAIYPYISNSYGLNEHTRIEKVLKCNLTKGLSEIYSFTQFNKELKSNKT
jgi:hypothetical protein